MPEQDYRTGGRRDIAYSNGENIEADKGTVKVSKLEYTLAGVVAIISLLGFIYWGLRQISEQCFSG